jgi:hypothetical protein
MVRCLSLTDQSLVLNGLTVSWLNSVKLKYILMLFPIHSLCLCVFAWVSDSASLSFHATHVFRFIKSPSTPGKPDLAPEQYVQMIKTFCSVPESFWSQPPASKTSTQGTQNCSWANVWHFCMMLSILKFCFDFDYMSFFMCLPVTDFHIVINWNYLYEQRVAMKKWEKWKSKSFCFLFHDRENNNGSASLNIMRILQVWKYSCAR